MCIDCPYIKDEYAARFNYLLNKGYDEPEISRSCYCDKVGGKIGWFGFCSDKDEEENPIINTDIFNENFDSLSYYNNNFAYDCHFANKEKSRKRRYNTEKYKNKLERQYKYCTSYPSPAYPVDKKGNYLLEDELDNLAYYKKCYKSKHADRYRFYKKVSNKMVRKHFSVCLDFEVYFFHYDWMDKDPEYMQMYCDEDGYDWDIREIIDEDSKYSLGKSKGAYKKVFEYWWNVD